jgi:Dolichyl-phosphate-mannose-protein mannosyltransferase
LAFGLILISIFLLHLPLLRLPYFWDEAGYYVPAARDFLLTGSLIPHSTPSNAHPPLVMIYLAFWWKVAAFSPLVTRTAMLVVAAFSLLGVFRLAQRVANVRVAAAATLCTAIYPVFFAQSTLAQVDLAAAGLSLWGLCSYVQGRRLSTVLWFSLAVLAKETAVLVPLALAAWEVGRAVFGKNLNLLTTEDTEGTEKHRPTAALFMLPVLPLAAWYAYHYSQTGMVFGNPEFFRYNVQATWHPLRILLAGLTRLWQTFGYMGLWLLTLATLLAMRLPALQDDKGERPRISLDVQLAFLVVVVVYGAAMSVLGGAVLARYMLPVVPLVIIVFVSTLWRRVRYWRVVVALVLLAFTLGLFINPPYGFSLEDNLAYRDYIVMHQGAAAFIETHYPQAQVLTAWPANDELSRPEVGYVTRPLSVLRIEDFSLEHLMAAADLREGFDLALVFSTKYVPRHPWLDQWQAWENVKARFFGFHRDVTPSVATQILGGRIVYSESRQGQWVAVIEVERAIEAQRSLLPSSHQMAGVGLHDEPDLTRGLEVERIARR